MPSLRLDVDQARARAFGLTPQDIAQTLQTLIGGVTVTTIRAGDERIDVVARAIPSERAALDRIDDLTIETRGGVAVPSARSRKSCAATEEPIIWRKDREVVITALGDVVDGAQPPDVSTSLWPKLAAIREACRRAIASRWAARSRNRRRATRRSSRPVPGDDPRHADAADAADAELLAARDRVLHRAARHRRRLDRAQPRASSRSASSRCSG